MMDYWRSADRITRCATVPSDHPPFRLAPVLFPVQGRWQGAGIERVTGTLALAPSKPFNG